MPVLCAQLCYLILYTDYNMVQKPISCCSEKPAFIVTYSVSGSEKDYLVCLSCINLEHFSKFIVEKISVKNNILKNNTTDSNYGGLNK